MKIRALAAALSAAGLLVIGAAVPAQAAPPVVHDHYSVDQSFDEEVCGLDVHFEGTYTGTFIVSPAVGSTEAFLAHDIYQFTETITLADDPEGPYVTTAGIGTLRETHAELLDPTKPTIYEFTSHDAGIFRVYDSSGAKIFQGSGVTQQVIIFDTLGDAAPGGELVEEVSMTFHGNETADFCEVLTAELTG